MNSGENGFLRLARVSGILLVTGLAIEAISLHWVHPIAFIAFALAGGALLAAGVLLFLYALVFESSPSNSISSGAN
jgi:hypothetical protein